MTRYADVVVVGCINLDQVAFVSRLPKPGETVFSSRFETHWGGKGANQAAQAALLMQDKASPAVRVSAYGSRQVSQNGESGSEQSCSSVAIIGRVGADDAGERFLKHFTSLGIDTRGMTADSHTPTGNALVTVATGGENTIAYMPGANATLTNEHIERDSAQLLLRSAKVVLSENGVPGPTSVKALSVAKEAGAVTIFTPSPVDNFEREICCYTDYFICNAVEALAILKQLGKQMDPREKEDESLIARQLHEKLIEAAGKFPAGSRGLANVVVTRGGQPCILCANGKASFISLAQQLDKELVKDTTGAGDSFAGAFAYFLLLKPDAPGNAISKATFVAAESVKKRGAAVSYACRHDLPDELFAA
ncbi:hypothetical protein Esti_003621 [Eimeria stiedai]